MDTEIETAKAKGQFNKGVVFLDQGVKEHCSDVIWRHPRANQGEVRPPVLSFAAEPASSCSLRVLSSEIAGWPCTSGYCLRPPVGLHTRRFVLGVVPALVCLAALLVFACAFTPWQCWAVVLMTV